MRKVPGITTNVFICSVDEFWGNIAHLHLEQAEEKKEDSDEVKF